MVGEVLNDVLNGRPAIRCMLPAHTQQHISVRAWVSVREGEEVVVL